ncbi:MAG: aldo/keto reductase [Planctomycetota bacterium]|jgi:aryl-alcohol dehydrogenase-like predicted oxidoreductase
MTKNNISRRELLKSSALAAAALAAGSKISFADCGKCSSHHDSKGLPTVTLGKTGAVVPLIGYGTGSRFCEVKDEEKALEMLTYALDNGLYYWDTAHSYGNEEHGVISEERLGKIVKHRRKEIFLSTKVDAREPDEAKEQIETSLKRLNTDYLDIIQIHSVTSVEDVEEITRSNGALDVVHDMKEQGVVKNVGFTGHCSAKAMALLAKKYNFDAMLIALNHYRDEVEDDKPQDFENKAIPVAAGSNLGIMLIKVIRPRETVKELKPKDLIRYALSLKHVNAAVISMTTLDNIKENISILKNFEPMGIEDMKEMQLALTPFYRHENLEWMRPGYRDGLLA